MPTGALETFLYVIICLYEQFNMGEMNWSRFYFQRQKFLQIQSLLHFCATELLSYFFPNETLYPPNAGKINPDDVQKSYLVRFNAHFCQSWLEKHFGWFSHYLSLNITGILGNRTKITLLSFKSLWLIHITCFLVIDIQMMVTC